MSHAGLGNDGAGLRVEVLLVECVPVSIVLLKSTGGLLSTQRERRGGGEDAPVQSDPLSLRYCLYYSP